MNASQPVTVYSYCRVSTARQSNSGLSLAEQKDRCSRYAISKGWKVTEVIEEVGSAYSKNLRLLDSLIERAVEGSTILVSSYDRFSRNVINGATNIHILSKKKVRVFSIQEQQDSLTPVGRYTFNITVAAAEFNSSLTGSKVTATFDKQKREGIEFGPAKYGQMVSKEVGANGKLLKRKRVCDDKESVVVELMTGLRNGITSKQATALMNRIVPPAQRAEVEFLDSSNNIVPEIQAKALSYKDIAVLLSEYNVPYRDGKKWSGEIVRRIIK